MLRTHPARVLVAAAVLAVGLLLLSAPGADATSGAWYYISAFGWFGFLLMTLTFLVLAAIAVTNRLRHRTTA